MRSKLEYISSKLPNFKKENYDINELVKFKEHRNICGKNLFCGFDTDNIIGEFEFLSEVNDPNKITTYNVAKK